MSDDALVTKALRAELKNKLPGIKFRVTKAHYGRVDVQFNGLKYSNEREAVREIASKYQMGNFDSMTDSYEYSNRRSDIPQTQFVFVNPYGQNSDMA